MEGSFQELLDRAVDEVFYANRSLVLNFNGVAEDGIGC